MRCQLIHRFHKVIKQEQDRGACTGSNRDIHWRAPAPGGRDGELDGLAAPVLDNGNSSNAAGAATSAASKVSDNKFIYLYYYVLIVWMFQAAKRRRHVFTKSVVPRINDVAEARVSAVRPLQIGDFGFVYTQNAIMAAQGMITNYYYWSSVHATVPSYCIVFQNCRKECQTCCYYRFF